MIVAIDRLDGGRVVSTADRLSVSVSTGTFLVMFLFLFALTGLRFFAD